MSHSIPAVAPVAPHRAPRAALKAVIFAMTLTAAAAGAYEGAQAVTRHYSAPSSTVSYADQSTIDRTVQAANHSPATAGDFISSADISGGNVVSVVVAVN